MPSHESEALEGKQKLQMKTFSELAECLARIPPKITLYGLLFKYNYVGCLLLLMFSIDLLFAIKRDVYIFKDDFVDFRVTVNSSKFKKTRVFQHTLISSGMENRIVFQR